jgi:hypothetical protein
MATTSTDKSTTSTTSTDKSDKSDSTSTDKSDKSTQEEYAEAEKTVPAEDVKKVQEDPRFDLPRQTITTAEDAYQAYLREEIDESELRAVVSMYGNPKFSALKGNLERPDNAYNRTVPEDLYDDPSLKVSSLEERQKVLEEKREASEAATEEAEKEKEDSSTTSSTSSR